MPFSLPQSAPLTAPSSEGAYCGCAAGNSPINSNLTFLYAFGNIYNKQTRKELSLCIAKSVALR